MFNSLENNKKIAMLAPKIYNNEGGVYNNMSNLLSPYQIFIRKFIINKSKNLIVKNIKKPTYVNYISGSFMLLKTNFFKNAGLFDKRYFLYFEDQDICRTFKYLNYKILYDPSFSIVHKHRREHKGSLKLSIIAMISAIRYFNKWGWFKKL